MTGVSFVGHKILEKTKNDSYTQKVWNHCKTLDVNGNCVGGYDYPSGTHNKKVTGTIKTGSQNVYAEGKQVGYKGSTTQESCAWVGTPLNYDSGGSTHSSASGSITGQNGSNVYVNGKHMACKDVGVTNHESQLTHINEGSSKVFIGGQ